MNKRKTLKIAIIYLVSGSICVFMSPFIAGILSFPFIFLMKSLEQVIWLSATLIGIVIITGVVFVILGIKKLKQYL